VEKLTLSWKFPAARQPFNRLGPAQTGQIAAIFGERRSVGSLITR
jgi:hypothetical protein